MASIEEGVAFAALGVAVAETIKIYQDNAPSLKDVRAASPDPAKNFATRQMILDADMLGLIVVVALGGGGVILIRRAYPLLLAGAALLLISAYYRSVLNSSNGGM